MGDMKGYGSYITITDDTAYSGVVSTPLEGKNNSRWKSNLLGLCIASLSLVCVISFISVSPARNATEFFEVLEKNMPSLSSSNKIDQDSLPENVTLNYDKKLTSSNGLYKAFLQKDGNFVIHKAGKPIWAVSWKMSRWQCSDAYIMLQSNGNLVRACPSSSQSWESGSTNMGQGPYIALLGDDGNIVVNDANGISIWSTYHGDV
mmetsp:Transcript_16821/g.16910  ORF Transcript_16821/g.16910 Transcript_16821/m.16910 type:complete len:204 (-) Transcript_16821:177-788(-)